MIDENEKKIIITLRLLISRAAQKDSLKWWEDDSLTPEGFYLLERLFPTAPLNAGKKLALEAANNRYHAAFIGNENVLHIFNLDMTGDTEYSLQNVHLDDIHIPPTPINTIDDLKHHLLEIVGAPPSYKVAGIHSTNCLEINLDSSIKKPSILDLAKTLSWAILEGKSAQPVFPYIQTTL